MTGPSPRAARRPPVGAAVALVALLLALGLAAAAAQEPIRVAGRVQWLGGMRMQVMSDDGPTIPVDLRQTDQGSYQGLRVGDHVIVTGTVSPDRNRVMARDIVRDEGPGGLATQAP